MEENGGNQYQKIGNEVFIKMYNQYIKETNIFVTDTQC